MLRLCLPILFLFSFPAHGEDTPFQPDSLWLLAYSVQDEFCQDMLDRLNKDIIDDGKVSPADYPEVKAIDWVNDNKILFEDLSSYSASPPIFNQNRVAVSDVNNDGKDEVVWILEQGDISQPGFNEPAFSYFDIHLKDKILEEGIPARDLYKNTLGDILNLEDGRDRHLGGYFSLVNLPLQTVTRLNVLRESIVPFEHHAGLNKQYEIYPLIYNNSFYILMIGALTISQPIELEGKLITSEPFEYDLKSGQKNAVVIRSYDASNKVRDTCNFLSYPI